jgi:hypothetical protein
LVAAADLELATFGSEQVPEIVRLNRHVAEFGVADPGLETTLDALLLKHEAQGEVLSRVAQKLHQRHLTEPVGVIP